MWGRFRDGIEKNQLKRRLVNFLTSFPRGKGAGAAILRGEDKGSLSAQGISSIYSSGEKEGKGGGESGGVPLGQHWRKGGGGGVLRTEGTPTIIRAQKGAGFKT